MKPVPPNAYRPGTQLTVGSHKVSVTKYLSEGGYAHVYTCEISPPYNDNKVACLKRVAVPDKVTLNILRAEVDAMKRLKGHRCIVSYIDSHASRMANGVGYEVFVLMEYCSGNGLIDFMNSRLVNKLTESEVLKIMAEITEGVCNMHAMSPPLIHRDIKIENVLISGEGNYKLCDFGSASGILRPPRNVDEFKILQDDIMKHTTAQYRAPEMIDLYRGFPIDEKSDVWALGVFLYKVCYYTTPFENNHINGNSGGGEYAILHAKYTFPSSPHYSSRLKNIISKLLVVDPRARPNAYQLLEEVCKMRNQPVPIENWYKKKVSPSQEEIKPVLPSRQPLKEAPKITKATIPPHKSISTGQKDPFATIDKSKLFSNGHSSGISSYSHNNSKSQPSLNSSLGNMISSHIQDLNQNSAEMNRASDSEKFAKPLLKPSRPNSRTSSHIKRPVSMYVADDFKTYASSSDQLETLKQKITGRMETVEFEPDPKFHIDSNVDFLRNLSRQDSGRSIWRSQNTGDSVKSSYSRVSNHNTGSRKPSEELKKKRNSISSLKSLLTGDRKERIKAPTRSHSKSRTPSFDMYATKSSDSLNGFQSIYHSSSSSNNSANSVYSSTSAMNSRKSSESIKEDPEPPVERERPLQRTKSIQSRVAMLLNRTQEPAPAKTASGYGKYTEDGALRNTSTNGFKKPEVKRSITPQQLLYKTESKTSTGSTYSTITPQSTLNRVSTTSTPRASSGNGVSDLSPIGSTSLSTLTKKKAPPPKPRKPKYLKSPPKKKQESIPPTEKITSIEGISHKKKNSITSDIDVDDLERQFNERFPSAL